MSPKLPANVQGPAQPCPPWCHRQSALQMESWALPVGTLWNSKGPNWLWPPRDLGTISRWGHHEVTSPSLDTSGGWTSRPQKMETCLLSPESLALVTRQKRLAWRLPLSSFEDPALEPAEHMALGHEQSGRLLCVRSSGTQALCVWDLNILGTLVLSPVTGC